MEKGIMRGQDKIVILITTGSEKEARSIADMLLDRRKAACINIIPRVDSLFWWQGKVDLAHESLMVIKTKVMLLAEIVELVKGVHSYQVPEIIALPIVDGSEKELEGQARVVRLSVLSEVGNQLAGRYGARGVPTLIILSGDGEVVDRIVGVPDRDGIVEQVSSLLS